MPTENKIPFKTFCTKMERELAKSSAEELRAVVRAMAYETLPTERQSFLTKLERRQERSATVMDAKADLLTDIDDWISELGAAMQDAGDWEEWSGHGYDEYYDDEDSLGPYEKVVESVERLFDRADAAFDSGDFQLARATYAKLFGEALQLEDDYGRGVRADDLALDVNKTRARYLRAAYETTPSADRSRILYEQMQQVYTWLGGTRPRLNDILTISRHKLSDRDRFLGEWIAFLRKQKGNDADAWLREAIRLAHSIGFDSWDGGDKALFKRLQSIYFDLISSASLSPDQQARFLSWCINVTNRRVKAIVGGQHRASYGKAARLTAACAQVLRIRGSAREANALVTDIRNRFPRHRAFQDELNAAVQGIAQSG